MIGAHLSLMTKQGYLKRAAYKYFRQNGSDAYWQHRLKVLKGCLNNLIES